MGTFTGGRIIALVVTVSAFVAFVVITAFTGASWAALGFVLAAVGAVGVLCSDPADYDWANPRRKRRR